MQNSTAFTALIDGANHVLDGETIPNSPKWTINADAEYDFRLSDSWDGYVRLEWIYRDNINPNTTSLIYDGFPWDVPSYNFFNLRIGCRNEQFQFIAYAENLFDKDFYTNAYQKAFASRPVYRALLPEGWFESDLFLWRGLIMAFHSIRDSGFAPVEVIS